MYLDVEDQGTHPLFKNKECGTCHDPHASDYVASTVMPVKDLCVKCHEPIKKGLLESKARHLPVEEGKCTECHSPHGTRMKYQLLDRTNELCMSCHNRLIVTTDFKGHLQMEEGNCLSCHLSHFSDLSYLMKDKDPAICIQCHSADTERLLEAHREQLGKIGRCTTCHEPHLSTQPGLLRGIMHEPFIKGNCEACHE
jgi:predicted CXXCH cytochrome family protein